MRIISDFKDYYDVGLASDLDRDIVYYRHRKVTKKFSNQPSYRFMVGFCGSVYRGIRKFCGGNWVHFYSLDAFDDHLRSIHPDSILRFVFGDMKDCSLKAIKCEFRNRWVDVSNVRGERFSAWSFFNPNWKTRNFDLFLGVPIYVEYDNEHVVNERLNLLDFMRVKDPFTAYQELRMFMQNIAIPEKPMPIIPNDMRIHTHGFDKKWSFRREKKAK